MSLCFFRWRNYLLLARDEDPEKWNKTLADFKGKFDQKRKVTFLQCFNAFCPKNWAWFAATKLLESTKQWKVGHFYFPIVPKLRACLQMNDAIQKLLRVHHPSLQMKIPLFILLPGKVEPNPTNPLSSVGNTDQIILNAELRTAFTANFLLHLFYYSCSHLIDAFACSHLARST